MNADKTHRIGPFELILPHDHALDEYQARYRLYDWVLGELVPLLLAKYPGATAIDIGANVGDTAAVLCRKRAIPVLCIEGHPRFVPYLRGNLARLPDGIEIEECLVGAEPGWVPASSFVADHGTALVDRGGGASADDPRTAVRPLAHILRAHPRFQQARLLKTDTDGSDFEILAASLDMLEARRPVLFFEYDPTLRPDGPRRAAETVSMLRQAGYRRFLVYDNFGNLLARVERDAGREFAALDRYLFSNLYFGRRIYYYDVCAFSAADEDLCDELETVHRLLIEAAMREDGRDF